MPDLTEFEMEPTRKMGEGVSMPTQVFYGHLNEIFNANLKTIEFFSFPFVFFYELCGKHIVISFELCERVFETPETIFSLFFEYIKLTVFAAECDPVACDS